MQAIMTLNDMRTLRLKVDQMSRNTMSFALPESLRDYIDARVRDGSYGNTSEYLRELIRRDQEQQAAARLREQGSRVRCRHRRR